MKKRNYLVLIYFIFLFIYEELIFHLAVFKNISFNFIYVVLFSIPFGIIFYLLSSIGKKVVNSVIVYLLSLLVLVLFISNLIYYNVYLSVISFYSMINGGQAFEFMDTILSVALSNWHIILFMSLPIILLIIFHSFKKVSFEKIKNKTRLVLIGVTVLIYILTIIVLNLASSKEVYSPKNLYYNIHSPLLTVDKFGLVTMFRLDLQRTVLGFSEKDIDLENMDGYVSEVSYADEIKFNTLEINWNKLILNEKNETIKSMHKYFSTVTPTKQNDYTGMFEGKNLIVFVAEAFSPMAINEELTPNLYRLYKEGFQFDNFYTPLYPVSTADGEYISDTSLIPKEGVWSIKHINGNYMPFSYANVFENLGYKSHSYHNNTYTYYNRDTYLKTMGYDSYLACYNGIEKRINCRIWPQSDYQMVNTTVDDYINDDKFITYYMTVSGHLEYSPSDNMMVSWNWDKVKNLNYSTAAKSYLAANIEFDKSLGELISRLEKSGKLADTVIAISGDHYPYGLTLDEVNELSSYKKDKDFEMHHMSFLIWNSEMKEPVKVNKYACSLDILPTLLNLFGIEYDSRLLMGTDIMSDSMPLVIYSNRSFITDKCRYNALTKEIIPNGDSTCTSKEVENINNLIYNKYKYSRLVLENDYYRKLYQSLGWKIRQ